MSARKLKRRAMARMSWPVVTITLPRELLQAVPFAMRDYLIRKALHDHLQQATTNRARPVHQASQERDASVTRTGHAASHNNPTEDRA